MLTTPSAVKGNLHFSSSLAVPFAVCSIATITLDLQATRSIAPPIPLTILPGIIQLAISPDLLTYIAPRIVRSRCPPLTMANDWEEENREAPLAKVIVSQSISQYYLPSVDLISMLSSLLRIITHSQYSILAMNINFDILIKVSRKQSRNANTQINHHSCLNLLRYPLDYLYPYISSFYGFVISFIHQLLYLLLAKRVLRVRQKYSINIHTRSMHLIRFNPIYYLLNLCYYNLTCCCHILVKIPCSTVINQISIFVCLLCFYQCEISHYALLQHIVIALKSPHLFRIRLYLHRSLLFFVCLGGTLFILYRESTLLNPSLISSWCIKCWYPCSSSSYLLCKGALRNKFNLQLA